MTNMTNQEIVSFRDRIFATTEFYDLQNIAVELLHRYGDEEEADKAADGKSFLFLAHDAVQRHADYILQGLLLCCEAHYTLCGGEGDQMAMNYSDEAARPTDQKPGTYVVKAYVPGPGGDHHESEVYTLRACGSAEVAADFSQTAQEAADRFYSTEDIPADWKYEAEDWLDNKLQPLNQQHDEEVAHICISKGIPQRYSQEGLSVDQLNAVHEQAAALVGCSINPNDPKMWYRCGMERPRYYVEEVPTG